MRRKPKETLDIQVDMVRWLHTSVGESFVRHFVESVEESNSAKENVIWVDIAPERMLAQLRFDLDRSNTYWVSDEMCMLTEHAARSMETQPLRVQDMPSMRGFVWLDKILYVQDVHNQKCGVRAISWGPSQIRVTNVPGLSGVNDGIVLCFWTDRDDTEDSFVQDMVADGSDKFKQLAPPLVLFHYESWIFGLGFHTRDEDGEAPVIGTMMRQFTQALWTLMQQPLATRRRHDPDRHQMKRAIRGGILLEEPSIQIITLRKVVPRHGSDDEGGEVVDWSHRWWVDGHWRWQYYPSKGEHRQIYISPHIKGPEDRPLVLKDRVYRFSR